MSEQLNANAWCDFETARRYKIFTDKTTMYQELSQILVDLAEIKPGMRVLDLGCGTGVTTRYVLERLGRQGQVIALDISNPMLEIARQQINSEQVLFVRADAAQIGQILVEPVDRIVCNSVFWQLRHKAEVLETLHQVLTPQGRFIFNVPEPYFIPKQIPRSKKVSILFKQLAAERYGVGQQDFRTIEVFLNRHHFELITSQEFERTRSAEESYLFFQLPVATAWMEPPLDFKSRLALLEEAQHLADPGQTVKQRWVYFVAEKR